MPHQALGAGHQRYILFGAACVKHRVGNPAHAPVARRRRRMCRLDDLMLYAGSAKKVIALVARDKRLMRLELTLPPALTTWRLAVREAARVNDWLDPQA